jgi:hypothetical protein
MAIAIFAPQMSLFRGWYFLASPDYPVLTLVFHRIVTIRYHVYSWECTVRFFHIDYSFLADSESRSGQFKGANFT